VLKKFENSEAGDQRLLLRLTDCHKWGPPGIDTGPYTLQHLHQWSTQWFENTSTHQLCWWH